MKRNDGKLTLLVMCVPLALTLFITIYAMVKFGMETGLIAGFISLFLIGGLESVFGIGFFGFKKWADADRKMAAEFDRKLKQQGAETDRSETNSPPK